MCDSPSVGVSAKGWGGRMSCKAWKGKTLWRITTELLIPKSVHSAALHKLAQRAVMAKWSEMYWKATGAWGWRKVKEEFRWYFDKEQGNRSMLIDKLEMNTILRFSNTAVTFEIVSLLKELMEIGLHSPWLEKDRHWTYFYRKRRRARRSLESTQKNARSYH